MLHKAMADKGRWRAPCIIPTFYLFSDGIREKDKDSLGSMLNQVAVTKDNAYMLAKHLYAEVRLDWPFYTDEDKQILKK